VDKKKIVFTGVVLAGGRSMRMGRDKALLTLPNGRTLLQQAVATLREAGAAEILVSVGNGKTYGLPDTREILDVQDGCGPMGGLQAALAEARQALCVVLAVDLPAMTPVYLGGLLAEVDLNCGIVPLIEGSAEPLAAVYPKAALAEVELAMKTQDYSLQRLIRKLEALRLARLRVVGEAERVLFANWNSPEDCH
jgi:molybdopterin-guanine dinucleotide biosynthesis protein A